MDCDDPVGQIFVACVLESCFLDQGFEVLLAVEFFYGFHQILVTFLVLSDDFSHERDQLEVVEVVELGQKRVLNLGKFETEEATLKIRREKTVVLI